MDVTEKDGVISTDTLPSVTDTTDTDTPSPFTHVDASQPVPVKSPSAVTASPPTPSNADCNHSDGTHDDAADYHSDDSETDTASETEEEFVDAFDSLHLPPPGKQPSCDATQRDDRRSAHERMERDEYSKGIAFSRSAASKDFAEPSEFDVEDNEELAGEEEKEDVVDEEALIAKEALLSEEEKERSRVESRRLKDVGNELYKQADYAAAAQAYTDALAACLLSHKQDCAVLYANRAAANMKQEKYEPAIADCDKAMELNPDYMKALLRRAELHERTDKLDEALTDYQRALERDPSLHQARAACMRLPEQIQVRNEKMKEEMMGKLKDLGNLVLRPFGLSTDNFKLQKDPNSGGYSINFQQNAG